MSELRFTDSNATGPEGQPSYELRFDQEWGYCGNAAVLVLNYHGVRVPVSRFGLRMLAAFFAAAAEEAERRECAG